MKNILFLGGGRSNIGAVKTAKELGYGIYVVGMPGDYPCYPLADKIITANIMDKEAVDKALHGINFDGVLICCSDRAIEVVGFLNDKYGLSGITECAAKYSCDKYKMKQALIEGNVSTAKFIKIRSKEDLQMADCQLEYPLIIKAVDLQSSKGIYICLSKEDLFANYQRVLKDTHKDYCIVEEFIKGTELGAQAFVYHNEVLFVQPHGDIISFCDNSSVPIGHYTPLDMPQKTIDRISQETKKAITALGLNNCAVNIDFIVRDGIPFVLELTGRVGANCLPEMIGHHFGFNYYKMIVSMAVSEDPRPFFSSTGERPFTLTQMINSDKSGYLKGLVYDKEMLPYVSFFVNEGDEIRAFRNSNDCIGEMLAVGQDMEDCERQMCEFKNTIQIDIL